ncbi:amino acid transporter [Stereum hirsutum FP-91666 SS1]|uniref:amino acid transporter n=1 Tax=Stereum hirsutum (strain FP-91666) TaxID=721885 RepID=UPI0004449288|nr:amino acid transporter [Stereum hirsutum FP-91666 SS1]EIM82927.1 amino acid transporter [Stereum hirsutum FP-91666 SS1]
MTTLASKPDFESHNNPPTTTVDAPPEVIISDNRLHELGYQTAFRREMSLFGVLGISFCAIGILTGMSSAFQTGLFSGGPLGLFWGWNICSFFMLLIALCLAEICSAYPTTGGLYFWVCKLKPDAPVLGCDSLLGFNAVAYHDPGEPCSVALYLASLAEVGQSRILTRVEIAVIAFGVNIASGIINTVGTKAIGGMSTFNVWWTLGGTFVLVITLLVKAPVKVQVHTRLLNILRTLLTDCLRSFTGWGNKGFVVLLGFLQAVYSLEGCETAAQVAEEAKRAELLAPLAIVFSIVGSYIVGLAYMLALLFSVQSIPSVQATSYALPITQLYYDAVGPKLTLMCLTVVCCAQFMAAVTAFTASSRLIFALARDGAVGGPARVKFETLNRWQAPYWGIWLSVLVGCIISCAYIGSTIAFNAILSSAAIAVMLSYLAPIIIRVFWPNSLKERGPFTLGRWSWIINFASLLFTVFICVLFILPTAQPVTADDMNYSIAAIGAVFILVGLSWLFWGRFHFKGPVSEIDQGEEVVVEDEKVEVPVDRKS